jgi:hypothetical protein
MSNIIEASVGAEGMKAKFLGLSAETTVPERTST